MFYLLYVPSFCGLALHGLYLYGLSRYGLLYMFLVCTILLSNQYVLSSQNLARPCFIQSHYNDDDDHVDDDADDNADGDFSLNEIQAIVCSNFSPFP